METIYVDLKFNPSTNKIEVECSRRAQIYGCFDVEMSAPCCFYNSRYYREKYHCVNCPIVKLHHQK